VGKPYFEAALFIRVFVDESGEGTGRIIVFYYDSLDVDVSQEAHEQDTFLSPYVYRIPDSLLKKFCGCNDNVVYPGWVYL
jgi:hypothetical protein